MTDSWTSPRPAGVGKHTLALSYQPFKRALHVDTRWSANSTPNGSRDIVSAVPLKGYATMRVSVSATARSQRVRNNPVSASFVVSSYTLEPWISLSKSSFISGAARKSKSAELILIGRRTPKGRIRSRVMQHHHNRFNAFLLSAVKDLLV